ncbi:hypothetical protein CS022_07210 [Veronia nyctiphanis]|uniref:Uncharacterized protein n=1 Tax=Veronia nyctiphanis TaxID=1278244 RepID=A0A4Q0YRH3_9GAMM|nr:hypothetical protein CS022_07210 [Veronia nyctiphanis]
MCEETAWFLFQSVKNCKKSNIQAENKFNLYFKINYLYLNLKVHARRSDKEKDPKLKSVKDRST